MIRDFGQLFLLTKIKKILREKNRNYEIHTFAFKTENYSFEQRTTSSTFSQGKNSTIIARTTRRSGFRSFSTDYREIQHSSLRFQNYSWRPRESIFGKLRAGYVRNRSPLRIREGVKKGREGEKKARRKKGKQKAERPIARVTGAGRESTTTPVYVRVRARWNGICGGGAGGTNQEATNKRRSYEKYRQNA